MPQHREEFVLASVGIGQLGNLRTQVIFDTLAHRHFGFEQLRLLLEIGDAALTFVEVGQGGVAFGWNDV